MFCLNFILAMATMVVLSTAASAQNCDEKTKGEALSANILACLIGESSQARQDVSERIARLVLDANLNGERFVTEGVLRGPGAQAKIRAEVSSWVAANPGDAASVYFVARPLAGTPSWLARHPKGARVFKDEENDLPRRLESYLSGTNSSFPEAKSLVRTVDSVGQGGALSSFLAEAVEGAHRVLSGNRHPSLALERFGLRDAAEGTVLLASARGSLESAASANFDAEDLFVTGAVVADVYGPKDDGSRTLSVKMVTLLRNGYAQNMLAVVDITRNDPTSPHGPHLIPMDKSDGETFTMRKGGRPYYVGVELERGEHRVVIKRPGSRDSGDGVISTSMEDLAMRRLDQAAQSNTVDIGGKAYYVLGQSAVKGALLFFAKDDVDDRRNLRDPRTVKPAAMAFVSEVVGGMSTRVRGRPDLGEIDGVPYHLEFDDYHWIVVRGRGDS